MADSASTQPPPADRTPGRASAILRTNRQRILERMAAAARRARRDPAAVKLVAVTKSVGPDSVRALIDLGQRDLGENRVQALKQRSSMVQELLLRRRTLSGDAAPPPIWHMIGHLQRNKVRSLLAHDAVIHGVDSVRLAEEIAAEAERRGRTVSVFLQVNVAGEKSKHGVAVGAVDVMAETLTRQPQLRACGLMAMAPYHDDPEAVRGVFARLRELADDLRHRGVVDAATFTDLSMGMSHDMEVAIEEGATVVRVGSALFEGLDPASSGG